MQVSRVLESCLYAERLDQCAAFYERVLGLEPFARAEGRHVFFRAGPGVFLLFNPAATGQPDGDLPAHGARGPGHLAFAVEAAELDAWRARLREAGVQIEAETEWPAGGRSLYFRDPAGNSVELAPPGIWGIAEPA